eukprot:COSAG02_NODE_61554_length_268_cov_0.615385_1_plen_27_part_10
MEPVLADAAISMVDLTAKVNQLEVRVH